MKHIQKRNLPAELRRWIEGQPIENGQHLNCRYEDMPSEVKRIVKQRLLEEQGSLCCYTGIYIGENDSHIEHFKPQTHCVSHEDVDYNNLLAAYPNEHREQQYGRCKYGAHAKADWYDENLLISPLHGNCESRFKYNVSGKIAPANEGDLAAVETIERLGLANESLAELRKQAIERALFRTGHQSLSTQQLRNIAQSYCTRDHQQNFRAFCFVIAQAAQQLLRQAERERKRKQFTRQQNRK